MSGIGYFTLPYLVHAGATHVHACEWNPDALKALQSNLVANGVFDRCTIHQGDNRQVTYLFSFHTAYLSCVVDTQQQNELCPSNCKCWIVPSSGYIYSRRHWKSYQSKWFWWVHITINQSNVVINLLDCHLCFFLCKFAVISYTFIQCIDLNCINHLITSGKSLCFNSFIMLCVMKDD